MLCGSTKSSTPQTYFYDLHCNPHLPIHKELDYIIYYFNKFSTFIIISDTGSGKTTQIPKIVYSCASVEKRTVCCVQPRRIAATTLAAHVADECKSKLGDLVGYKVRFDEMKSSNTGIVYMTDGILLREAILNKILSDYHVIILDEVHERSVQMDALIGLVKRAQRQRAKSNNPLKIILMSATMNVDIFSSYFNNCPVLVCAGREYPLKIFHSKNTDIPGYVDSCIATTLRLHAEKPVGEGILVFLTGQEEIYMTVRLLRKIISEKPDFYRFPATVKPLYGAQPLEIQNEAFELPKENVRKIVISTNIAETSVTITGITHVVDSGKVKTKKYDPKRMMEVMNVCPVSRAQSVQRAGRAAREGPGFCYRVYTEEEYKNMSKYNIAEIHRTRLSDTLLLLMTVGVKNVENFDFIEKPSVDSIKDSIDELKVLKAITCDESNQFALTKIGRRMIELPVDVRLARILVESHSLCCSEEILTVVSMMTVDTYIYIPFDKREKAANVHQRFLDPYSDHISSLNVFREYASAVNKREWCKANYINKSNMSMASAIKAQLKDLLKASIQEIVSCGKNYDSVKQCLIPGLIRNIAEYKADDVYETISFRQRVYIHPSSVLYKSGTPLVVFQEILESKGKCYICHVTAIKKEWVQMYI